MHLEPHAATWIDQDGCLLLSLYASQPIAKPLVKVSTYRGDPSDTSTLYHPQGWQRDARLGLGVWRLSDGDAPNLVADAINAGYRHIDTAQAYQNEGGVGQGLKSTNVRRRDIWITSKLQTSLQGYGSTLRAFDQTMAKLELDQLDLFLVHWPAPARNQYVQTWKAFIELQQQGRIRSIGASNFLPEHLERIIGETGVTPAVNQIELHPNFSKGGPLPDG